MNKNQGGCYRIENGVRTQVQAPTKVRFREIYSEEEEAKDNALVEHVIDALRALEKRAEELKPGITDDPDNALPELAERWKSDSFPKVGLAMLHNMMTKGGSDLLGAATAWEVHRNAIKKAREFYPAKYPNEPLRLALWEHGLANYRGFPTSYSCAETIDESFSDFWALRTTYFGENALYPNDVQEVMAAAREADKKEKRDEKTKLANLFFNLYNTDSKYTKTENGYAEAAKELENQGIYVSWSTLKSAVENSEDSIWQDLKAEGIPPNIIKAKKKSTK